jgi:RNA-directed DNA polymerase
LPENIHGGIKGKDNITNTKLHKGKKYHLVTDISDFFPSISNREVFRMLKDYGFSNDVAHILTKLTTYLGKVPQGAPTSTGIANLVFSKVDKILIDFCEQNHIIYSRFVDDLSFSSDKDFKPLVNQIISIITSFGFKINRRKTHYKVGPVDITGINVRNNCLRPTKELLLRHRHKKSSPSSKEGRNRYIKRIIQEGRPNKVLKPIRKA